MKNIALADYCNEILTADNPERYAIRFKKIGIKSIYLLLLQIEGDNYILTETREQVTAKSKCKVLSEGLIEDFCFKYKAIEYGMLYPDIAIEKYFNENYK